MHEANISGGNENRFTFISESQSLNNGILLWGFFFDQVGQIGSFFMKHVTLFQCHTVQWLKNAENVKQHGEKSCQSFNIKDLQLAVFGTCLSEAAAVALSAPPGGSSESSSSHFLSSTSLSCCLGAHCTEVCAKPSVDEPLLWAPLLSTLAPPPPGIHSQWQPVIMATAWVTGRSRSGGSGLVQAACRDPAAVFN